MKRLVTVLMAGAVTLTVAYGQDSMMTTQVTSNASQTQNVQAIGGGNAISDSSSISWAEGGSAEGGSAVAEAGDSESSSIIYYAPSSTSNYKARTAPLTTYPPYLPMWQHGGWGTIKAYFPNGPTMHDKVYERTFDPSSELDMKEVKGILRSLPYDGALEVVGGFLNSVRTLFGGPDQYHHGRGFEIANSVVRDRRPEGKPLLVFIDSYVDPVLMEEEGYAYVGRISLEGSHKRNWDHVYNAAIAEALPWDVDILLISGGMKGVSVGSTASLGGGGGYSQTNYSLSLLPGRSKGVTEGKGEAVMSATAYRFCPERLGRSRIPQALYDRIRRRPQAAAAPQPTPAVARTAPAAPAAQPARPATPAVVAADEDEHVAAPQVDVRQRAGIEMSRELYNMAGFSAGQTVNNVQVR